MKNLRTMLVTLLFVVGSSSIALASGKQVSVKGDIALILSIITMATVIFAGGHYLDIIQKGKFKLYIELIGALAGLIAVISYVIITFYKVKSTAGLM